MRILFWAEGFWPHTGGVSVIAPQYVAAMHRRGVEFTIVTSLHPERPRRDDFLGIPVYRSPFSSMLVQRNLKEIRILRDQLVELERKFQPHLIHIYEYGVTNFYDLLTSSDDSVPKLYTVQSPPPQSAN